MLLSPSLKAAFTCKRTICLCVYLSKTQVLTSMSSCFLICREPQGFLDVRSVSQDGFQNGFLLCRETERTHIKTSFEAWGNLAQRATWLAAHNSLQQVFLMSLWLVSCDKTVHQSLPRPIEKLSVICVLSGGINRDLQRVLQTLKHLVKS